MAGINRLGKAPPRPGSLRPPDPNKYKTENMYSLGGENDAEYLRMVQDIEDTQANTTGWLFGRGAFDKGDLLYMRDEDEKRRFMEQQLRDGERSQFKRLKAADSLQQLDAAPAPGARPKDKPGAKAKPGAAIIRTSAQRPADSAPRIPGPSPARPAKPQQGPAVAAAAASKPAAPPAAGGVAKPPIPKQPPPAADLAGMLGGYGSDSESD